MAVRPLVHIGDPSLRIPTTPVDLAALGSHEIQGALDDLIETMRHANGAGLAANQMGWDARACAIEVQANHPRYPYKAPIALTVLINPTITALGPETFNNDEGCLSVPGFRGTVARFTRVRIQAFDRFGGAIDQVVQGLTAGTFQHEVDHLDGRLFVDGVQDPGTFSTWDNWQRFRKPAFEIQARALVARFGQ